MNVTTTPVLLDTAIMMDCLRGHAPATLFFVAVNQTCIPRLCRISASALLAGCSSDAERILARRFFGVLQILEQTAPIARRAFDSLDTVALPTPLTASDALIAATAIEHSLPLYTLDPARFTAVSALTAIRPY